MNNRVSKMEENKEMPDLLKMSLYDSLELKDFLPEQLIQILTFLEHEIDEYTISSIDCYCNECSKNTTFKSRNTSEKILEKVYLTKKACEKYNRHTGNWEIETERFNSMLHEIEFFTRSFYCPRFQNNKAHDITFILRVTGNQITKNGQFPSIATIENSHLLKYKKLNTEIYKELNTASGLNSHGIGVGAFVYLRRIIEKHIVYPVIEEMISNGELQKEEIISVDFKQKVNLAKSKLPLVLTDNTNLYSILSKGIHLLSEQECIKFFPPLLTAIELILDDRLEKLNRKEKNNKLKSDLGKISQVI